MLDEHNSPVLLEANRSSHMLGEYRELVGDARPFEITAAAMNAADGPPCILYRASDPLPDLTTIPSPEEDEDVTFIHRQLHPYLRQPAVIGNVEDNAADARGPADDRLFVARDGSRVRPGSIFRWWYGLPWEFERNGVLVINPNAVWMTVRDKLRCYETLQSATRFRVPRSFAVNTPHEVAPLLREHAELFSQGYVLKPRVGWGGQGVQVADRDEPPLPFTGQYMLCERIRPPSRLPSHQTANRPGIDRARYWDVRAFVFAGTYLGGIVHSSDQPVTNYWRGGKPGRIDAATSELIGPAAEAAVRLISAAATTVMTFPSPPNTPLTNVEY